MQTLVTMSPVPDVFAASFHVYLLRLNRPNVWQCVLFLTCLSLCVRTDFLSCFWHVYICTEFEASNPSVPVEDEQTQCVLFLTCLYLHKVCVLFWPVYLHLHRVCGLQPGACRRWADSAHVLPGPAPAHEPLPQLGLDQLCGRVWQGLLTLPARQPSSLHCRAREVSTLSQLFSVKSLIYLL